MDDFVLLCNNKKQLHMLRSEIESYLADKLRLQLNSKTSIFPVAHGVDFVGYRTWTTHRLLRKRSIIGMKIKLKKLSKLYKTNERTLADIRQVIASWLGHANHANSYNVVKRVLSGAVFSKS